MTPAAASGAASGAGPRTARGLAAALPFLCCPICGLELGIAEGSVGCRSGHRFDVARQGYASLLRGSAGAGTGDTADMVVARQAFLDAGHHDALATRIARCAASLLDPQTGGGCVLDVGAGTGFILAEVLGALPRHVGIAVDLSKHALRRAARAHPRIGAVAADTWEQLPLHDDAVELVLCVFAPRNAEEFHRVLRPGGSLIVVTPTPRHLAEVVDLLGLVTVDARKPARLARQLESGLFIRVERSVHEQAWTLSQDEVEALVAMGPSARHTDPAAVRWRLRTLPEPVAVTCSVTVSAYRAV